MKAAEVAEEHWAVHCRVGRPEVSGRGVVLVKHRSCALACGCPCHWRTERDEREKRTA